MAKTLSYKGFNVGDRVVIQSIEHMEWTNHHIFVGAHGYIKSISKCRNMIWVMCDFGEEYGSYPQHLSLENPKCK